MIQKGRSDNKDVRAEWILNDHYREMAEAVQIKGNPGNLKYKNTRAVLFNGSSDGIFLESMPLKGLEQFTIEVIFQPQTGGEFEQRFLHFGEVNGDRVLLEIRSTQAGWYFDAFIKAGEEQKALIDPGLLHPLDQWYHIAYVVDNGKLETFVNSLKELEGKIDVVSLKGGKTSIGVRQNEVSWFKGGIYKIRITSKALVPDQFMQY